MTKRVSFFGALLKLFAGPKLYSGGRYGPRKGTYRNKPSSLMPRAKRRKRLF